MSHIFDALQRAEADRSGVELDAFDLPTELLQITESQSRNIAVRPEPADPGIAAELVAAVDEATREQISVDSAASLPFQSLPVSLPPYNKLVSVTEKDGLAAEKFRFLAVRLRHLQQQRSLRRLLITSSMPEEGKSTVAANLACTLANKKSQKILLVEGDLRRPTMASTFGLGSVRGMSEYLQSPANAALPIYRLEAVGIWIIPAGAVPENPLELIQSGRLSVLMNQLNSSFDWIVTDSPPILPLADTSVLARLSDAILLVARQGTTGKEQLKRAAEAVEKSKLLGTVVNSSTSSLHSDYYQRYGYSASAKRATSGRK